MSSKIKLERRELKKRRWKAEDRNSVLVRSD